MLQNLTFKCLLKMLKRPLRLYCVYLKAELFSCADSTRCCGTLNTVEPLSRRFHAGFTPVSHCKRGRRVSGTEAVRMQSRSSARPLPFHTCSVCSARLNSVFCTEWANSNLILNTIGLDLLE